MGSHLVFAGGCLQVDVLGFVGQRERYHRVLVFAVGAYLPVKQKYCTLDLNTNLGYWLLLAPGCIIALRLQQSDHCLD